jgi:pimeloyl-ACP methyl ester carboxylesterase
MKFMILCFVAAVVIKTRAGVGFPVVFKGWNDEEIKSIQAPALVVIGDHDVPRPEHAVEMSRLLPHGRLAIMLADIHGSYLGEALAPTPNSKVPELFVAMVDEFLSASGK